MQICELDYYLNDLWFICSMTQLLLITVLYQALKNAPGCIHPLVSRVLPYVSPVLNKVCPVRVLVTKLRYHCAIDYDFEGKNCF